MPLFKCVSVFGIIFPRGRSEHRSAVPFRGDLVWRTQDFREVLAIFKRSHTIKQVLLQSNDGLQCRRPAHAPARATA
ncbi:hypothetical protein EVAR_33012_1 [Eumeta japonica]|uniref:Uncharacterized protein n=1 Tax=Eumeta variegata TaxID=151549 RepID=A0A4C1VTZ3_EUMVA|nr:hypothetical protein EVAR_33012_1 [Eumeta japonica]